MSPGDRLGHYEIVEQLGAGGMGVVYRARDTTLRREVAIKLLPQGLSGDPERLARLEREAHLLAAMNHPNIAAIYSLEEAEGSRFLVLELIVGAPLSDLIAAGPLPVPAALEIAAQIARALDVAHGAGVVHRDLKPANVMVTDDGRVKVLDFGIAKAPASLAADVDLDNSPTAAVPITEAGVILGTAPYMSPEQVRGQPVDDRSDIWAFGCVLYELLTGTRAFRRETAADTLAAILETEPDWTALPENLPENILGLLERCLRKDHRLRLDSLSDADAELIEALTGPLVVAARPVGSPYRRAAIAAVSAAAIALLVALGLNIGGMQDRVRSDGFWPFSAPAPEASARIRIAVLPFDNLGLENDHYLSEGISREVSTQLSRVADFVVIAHGSARRASAMGLSYRELAEQIRADYLVAGSVSPARDRVRIMASLIDPATSEQLWANDYDRELSVAQVLAVRKDVAQEVASALDVALSQEDPTGGSPAPLSLEAYRAYQLGRFFWDKRTVDGLELAIEHFERAITLDTNYALAYAGLADAALVLPWFSSAFSNTAALARAEAAARRALELDPSLGQPHATLGLIKEWRYEWIAAEQEFLLAIANEPDYATGHHWYGNMLGRLGRHDEASAELRLSISLDPLSLIINQDVGYVLWLAGQSEAAIRQFRRTLDLNASFSTTRLVLVMALLEQGRFAEAREEIGSWAVTAGLEREPLEAIVDLVSRHASTGQRQDLPPELMNVASSLPPYFLPGLYVHLGQDEKALDILERAYANGAFAVVSSLADPLFEPLRSKPGFADLIRKIGLDR